MKPLPKKENPKNKNPPQTQPPKKYINFHVYVPWIDVYKSFKCREDTMLLTICNTIAINKNIDLIYKQNILCLGFPLSFYEITDGSILYAVEKGSKEYNVFLEEYHHYRLEDLKQVYDTSLYLSDVSKNKWEANSFCFRKIANQMKRYYEKQKEQPLKYQEKETKYTKPTMITSQSLPQFWW